MQKEFFLCAVSKKKNFSHCVQSSITQWQSFIGYHNASLLPNPQVSLTLAPFLGASRRWSVSSSSCWGRTWLGTGPRTLPVAIPSELVHPSNESGQGSVIQKVRTPVWKRTQNTIRWTTSLFVSGFLHSSPTEPPVHWLRGLALLESHWSSRNVAETSTRETKHYTWRVGELRFITAAQRSWHSKLWAATKGLESFMHIQAWLNRFAGLGDCKEQDKG